MSRPKRIAKVGQRVRISDLDYLKSWLRNATGIVEDIVSDSRENFYTVRLDSGGVAVVVDNELRPVE